MGKNQSLLIVESPAKARTIKKYLGRDYVVKASVGHVKDLPKSKIGVDVRDGFKPEYVIIPSKVKVIADLKRSAKQVKEVLLAPDPDREGEAIAWHIADEIKKQNKNIHRVLFNEITKKGVKEGLANPLELNRAKYESQQARRILDRLVGYEVSPILWKKVQYGLSAGRVQSVAVRLIVDREREREAFVSEEYWILSATLDGDAPPAFVAKLAKIGGDKAAVTNGEQAAKIVRDLEQASFTVASVEKKQRRRHAPAPLITSRLQQAAAQRFRFTAKRTMSTAQQLYEGVELGEAGAVGLITYMRTDSTRLSADAVVEARRYIAERHGADYVPEQPNFYKSKKSAQDAHEAIRPTSMEFPPDKVARYLSAEQQKIYGLVWERFVACQMTPAVYDQTGVDVVTQGGRYTLRATGQILRFAGWLAASGITVEGDEKPEGDEPAAPADDGTAALPELNEGQSVKLRAGDAGESAVKSEQKFTQPPARYNEGSLIRELEERGIGRPSTYAAIISTIQARRYVEKPEGGTEFLPTELGVLVNDQLVKHFPDVLDVGFTAEMEESLDKVEEGNEDWVKLLRRFYVPFHKTVTRAKTEMTDMKKMEVPTDYVCEKCGAKMVIRWGRNGRFLACSAYPACKNTSDVPGHGKPREAPRIIDDKCDKCGKPMAIRRGRFGEFIACTGYPECKNTKPVPIDGVKCPKCGGDVAGRRSRKGRTFFGCTNYGKTGCDFVVWDKPAAQPCPQCGAKFLVAAGKKTGGGLRCLTEGCGYRQAAPEPAEPTEPATASSR